MKEYSNLSKVIFRRTYARRDHGHLESRSEAIKRIIEGNIGPYKGTAMLLPNEAERLDYFMSEGKCGPAGRGWWFSGSPVHAKRGAIALNNCFHVVADHWRAYPIAADMLMCGGGVGMSVEHRYVSKLPTVKRDVSVVHQPTKDADFIVPDSREGWCKLVYKMLEAFFETGKSFSYSTVCIRGYGEPLKGFGGLSAGPMPLIAFVEKASALLKSREGKKMRPIDAADMLCAIGEMVVAGNIRRSALLIQGDCFDKEFLKAKRWDLGSIPTYRAMANFSVVCDDVDDLHPLFWKTYEHGEPFGIINVKNMQTYGRMGEKRKDNCTGVNPCASPDTLVLTKRGHFKIKDLVGRVVDVWDGTQWVTVDNFRVTGYNQPMLKITMQDGSEERVTPYHQMILENGERIEACKLSRGSRLAISNAPIVHGWWTPGDARVQGVFMQELAADTDHLNMSVFSWNIHARLEFLTGIMQKPRGAQSDDDEALHDLQSYNKKWLQYVQSLLKTVGISSVVSPSYSVSQWKLTLASAPPIVASVECDGVEEKVYCCTVPETHAFSLTSGYLYGQCAEAVLEPYESCNLQDIALCNVADQAEFNECARLMHRWGKRVAMEKYHIPDTQAVVNKNHRIGTGITGCLRSPLFNPSALDEAYAVIQKENHDYSKLGGIAESIRTTVTKPSGSFSKLVDAGQYEGIHPAFSRYMIQRIRFGANDPLIPLLRAAGHHIEPEMRFDGSLNQNTLVVDFYERAADGCPVADEDWDTWKQLDIVKLAQKHWADQSVSVTVYYRKEDIPKLKEWLADNLKYIKTISFLCANDHGFKQAPKEAISKEAYEKAASGIKPIPEDEIGEGELESVECAGGACPIK